MRGFHHRASHFTRYVLKPSNLKLYAANETEIPLLSKTTVELSVQGRTYSASLAVSEAIQEMILGIDWIQTNESHWYFGSGTTSIGGQSIKLCSRPYAKVVKKIYVERNCEVTFYSRVRRVSLYHLAESADKIRRIGLGA